MGSAGWGAALSGGMGGGLNPGASLAMSSFFPGGGGGMSNGLPSLPAIPGRLPSLPGRIPSLPGSLGSLPGGIPSLPLGLQRTFDMDDGAASAAMLPPLSQPPHF
jgi:hypothetical protein